MIVVSLDRILEVSKNIVGLDLVVLDRIDDNNFTIEFRNIYIYGRIELKVSNGNIIEYGYAVGEEPWRGSQMRIHPESVMYLLNICGYKCSIDIARIPVPSSDEDEVPPLGILVSFGGETDQSMELIKSMMEKSRAQSMRLQTRIVETLVDSDGDINLDEENTHLNYRHILVFRDETGDYKVREEDGFFNLFEYAIKNADYAEIYSYQEHYVDDYPDEVTLEYIDMVYRDYQRHELTNVIKIEDGKVLTTLKPMFFTEENKRPQ